MNKSIVHRLSALGLILSLGACGGGGDTLPDAAYAPSGIQQEEHHAGVLAVADIHSASAVIATAQSTSNACAQIRPFYWEMGTREGRVASGSVSDPASLNTAPLYAATTRMSIASASKWIYGAFVVERANGVLSELDRKFLTMRSGYVNFDSFDSCKPGQTVDGCLNTGSNGAYSPDADGRFYYDGGHMQKHGSLTGLGGMKANALTKAISAEIGTDVKMVFSRAQIPGAIVTTPDAYAKFLRKMLDGRLILGSLLGTDTVCTNPATCAAREALYTPIPAGETWHYSLGHWVEDDPVVGDGAFSSAGAFGFYPWIDAGKTSYGIIARVGQSGSGYQSALCGRLMRKAWVTGASQ